MPRRLIAQWLAHRRLTRSYPGVSIARSATVQRDGRLELGAGTTLGERARLIVRSGSALTIGERCYIGREVEIAPAGAGEIRIGEYTSIQDRSIFHGNVTLGRYCVLSLNVFISSGTHQVDAVPQWLIRDQDAMVYGKPDKSHSASPPVSIGEDCWLGINVVISGGVRIGRGCVVGANSVVTDDLPPYSVAAGAPARIIRRRLEFAPNEAIDAARLEDLPYFYAGFDLQQSDLSPLRGNGAIAARSDFTICLRGPGDRVRLVVSADAPATLRHGAGTVEVRGARQALSLKAEPRDGAFYDFAASSRVLVHSASLGSA